jgi:PRC-barrel domain protein
VNGARAGERTAMDGRSKTSFSIEDLVGSRIETADGRRVGRVVDVEVEPAPSYRACALLYGLYGWLYRFHALRAAAKTMGLHARYEHIPWDAVAAYDGRTVRLKPGYPLDDE